MHENLAVNSRRVLPCGEENFIRGLEKIVVKLLRSPPLGRLRNEEGGG